VNTLRAKVAVLRNFLEPLEIKVINIPELRDYQVLVRVIYASFCGSQLFEWRGERDNSKWLPHVLGHEGYAEIVAKDEKVHTFNVGDKVIVSWLSNGLIESDPPRYLGIDGEYINAGKGAVFATHAVVSQSKIFKAPSGINPKVAPLWGCAIPTGAGMVRNLSGYRMNSRVLVRGFGGVGMAAAFCLKKLGFETVAIDDTSEERQQIARAATFSLRTELSTDTKYDLVIDTTGSAPALEESFTMLGDKGKLLFATHPPKNSKITIDPFDLISGKTIEGTWGGETKSQDDFDSLYELIGDSIFAENFIGTEFPFESINDALQYSLESRPGKALILIGEETNI
jgi:S-(hydroxymethyl)glutathione dehydrogenase/alcohol dehydrogenase